MIKRQIEARICDAVSKFETEVYGKGPKFIRTIVVQDLIIIRTGNAVSLAHRKIAESIDGIKQIKEFKVTQFEATKDYLKDLVVKIVRCDVISSHYETSTKTGENMIILAMRENIEEKLIVK
ncbi:MAG TPA: Na-translocating system protein MpsC family protein [Pseudobacteroides sp.]|uniref:Na-translocating system protein MpsC family protein n=1 Tax=Pseudobacteroides sp. TaxID=1968840 RepID=UPI002F9270F5